ncbi:MAG: hypothetical protein ACOYUZ_02100 [Patescibacteria group bacterium]
MIIGLIGPSGAGKSTLILEMLKKFPKLAIMKSFTTRSRRSPEDDLFYEFISEDQLHQMDKANRLTHISEYAGNYYTNDKVYLNNLLKNKIGLAALVESGVQFLRNAGYEVRVVKIIPKQYQQTGDISRLVADRERASINLEADLEIVNSFEPGGKEKALRELESFLKNFL